MKKYTIFPVTVNGKIDPENLVIIGYKIKSYPGGKLPGVHHGVGGIGKFIIHKTRISK